jgi:hypothetical protein
MDDGRWTMEVVEERWRIVSCLEVGEGHRSSTTGYRPINKKAPGLRPEAEGCGVMDLRIASGFRSQ